MNVMSSRNNLNYLHFNTWILQYLDLERNFQKALCWGQKSPESCTVDLTDHNKEVKMSDILSWFKLNRERINTKFT